MTTPASRNNVYPLISRSEKAWASRPEVESYLRGEIGGQRTIHSIRDILSWLVLGHVPNYASPRGLPNNPDATLLGWQPLLPQDVQRFKVVLDANLKLLNKVLPDLRSLDFNDQTPQPQLSDLELAARVASLVGRKQALLATNTPANRTQRGFATPSLPIDLIPTEIRIPAEVVHEARLQPRPSDPPIHPQTHPRDPLPDWAQ